MGAAGDLERGPRRILSTLDPVAREQYLDFIRLRRFRQSLLVRGGAPADADDRGRARARACTCRPRWELARGRGRGRGPQARTRARSGVGRRRAGAQAARRCSSPRQPATLPVASLDSQFDLGSLSRAARGRARGGVRRRASSSCTFGRPALTTVPPERPVASPLARLQARTREQCDDAPAHGGQHRRHECAEAVAARRRNARPRRARRCRSERRGSRSTVARRRLRRLRAPEVRPPRPADGGGAQPRECLSARRGRERTARRGETTSIRPPWPGSADALLHGGQRAEAGQEKKPRCGQRHGARDRRQAEAEPLPVPCCGNPALASLQRVRSSWSVDPGRDRPRQNGLVTKSENNSTPPLVSETKSVSVPVRSRSRN